MTVQTHGDLIHKDVYTRHPNEGTGERYCVCLYHWLQFLSLSLSLSLCPWLWSMATWSIQGHSRAYQVNTRLPEMSNFVRKVQETKSHVTVQGANWCDTPSDVKVCKKLDTDAVGLRPGHHSPTSILLDNNPV